jgi:hypothetical protein
MAIIAGPPGVLCHDTRATAATIRACASRARSQPRMLVIGPGEELSTRRSENSGSGMNPVALRSFSPRSAIGARGSGRKPPPGERRPRGPAIPAARRRSSMSGACPLSAARSILRRWLKARATSFSRTFGSASKRGAGRASRCTTAEDTLGGGENASGGSCHDDPRLAAPLRQHREPPIGLGSRLAPRSARPPRAGTSASGFPRGRPCGAA